MNGDTDHDPDPDRRVARLERLPARSAWPPDSGGQPCNVGRVGRCSMCQHAEPKTGASGSHNQTGTGRSAARQ